MSARYRTDLEEWADRFFGAERNLSKRKTFGCPAWYAGKKMIAFCYEDGIGTKLLPERVNEMIERDKEVFRHFNPGDGVMKNWLIIVHPDTDEYENDISLFQESIEHVLAI